MTQVVSPDLAAARRHSRESHTHKVAMVARELAELVVRRARTDHGVAELLARCGGLDIAACEAAGLAHDLGHAPFGHAGEVELHNLLRTVTEDGFEGNPQSFRIVTRLEGRTFKRTNMELTNVTLAAILKYPWNREDADLDDGSAPAADEGVSAAPDAAIAPTEVGSGAADTDTRVIEKPAKFGAYREDRAAYETVREKVMGADFATNRRQSLEACIMDLADDIAYAVHDLEDFCSAGLIDLKDVLIKLEDATKAVVTVGESEMFEASDSNDPFTRATEKLRKTYRGLFDDKEYYAALDRVENLVRQVDRRAYSEGSLPVVLRDVLSGKIGEYFQALDIDDQLPTDRAGYVRLSRGSWHEVQVLKVITRHWLIDSPQMGMIQRAQARAVRTLFESIVDWLRTSPTSSASIPAPLREALTNASVNLNAEKLGKLDERHYRAIGDYIGGLSDSEALLRSNWFAGRDIPGMTLVAEAY